MPIELKVPEIGESITEVEIGDWLKKTGEAVKKDEAIVTLESDKATVELPSPDAGTIGQVLKKPGDIAKVGEVIAYLENGKAETEQKPQKAEAVEVKPASDKPQPKAAEKELPKPKPPLEEQEPKPEEPTTPRPTIVKSGQDRPRSERLHEEPRAEREAPERPRPAARREAEPSAPTPAQPEEMSTREPQPDAPADRQEEVVRMSKLRRTVAERLVEAQRNAALLTTFNEVDMGEIMAMRKEYGESFQKKFNVKLGFMSFFVKASIDALKQFPSVNAEVRGTDIVYHNYYDIGVAIGSGKGLVVPVLRNAERMSFAEIEMAIGDFAKRAQENKLKPDELVGGTFTISNGGVYGSLLSTPIVNPPQSGVLGLHGIQERPVARDGQVVIRPMMYIALTYDHRIIDGREAVTFLKRIKDAIENPARMLIEV